MGPAQLMLLVTSALLLETSAAPTPVSSGGAPVQTVYQYPANTWIENLAVRPNGNLIVSLATAPHIDEIDPFIPTPEPTTIFAPSNSSAVFAISEILPDIYAVEVAQNYSMSGGAQPGAWLVWRLDLTSSAVSATPIGGEIRSALMLDGSSVLPSNNVSVQDNVLLGDIKRGLIYHFDTTTGAYKVVINNTFTQPAANYAFGVTGVNGLHVADGVLYYTNSGKDLFASLPINADGSPAGQAKVVTTVPNNASYYDDFAIKNNTVYLVTGGGNAIERVSLSESKSARIIAGSLNSTEIAGPTSCAFGRTEQDADILYVVTSGGIAAPVDGNTTVGAQVLAVDVGAWERENQIS